MQARSRQDIDYYIQGISEGNRVVLSKAITLIESSLSEDQMLAQELLAALMEKTGKSLRIGITGSPGVGKSTFIEAFGKFITSQSHSLAVLTIDPSSTLSNGSILGDKTRMQELAKDPRAFIRPSASGNVLGGVAQKTREVMLLCEAAGYDIIFIETVGVGQSETAIKGMIDFFVLLALPGAGDELQGIKKGIMEIADMIVVTKSDGDNVPRATQALSEYKHVLHLSQPKTSGWTPKTCATSALTGLGLEEVWATILDFESVTKQSGWLSENRKSQQLQWMDDYFKQALESDLQKKLPELDRASIKKAVAENRLSPFAAAQQLLQKYHEIFSGSKS